MTARKNLIAQFKSMSEKAHKRLDEEKKKPTRYLVGTSDAFCTQMDISENGNLLGFRNCNFESATVLDDYEPAVFLCQRMNASVVNSDRNFRYKVYTTEKILTLQAAAYDSVLEDLEK